MLSRRTSRLCGDARDEPQKLAVSRIAGPVRQVRSMSAPKFQRLLHIVEERRHEDVALRCSSGLVSHPLGPDRIFGPEHHDAVGGCQLTLDRFVEGLACDQFSVPPYGPSV